VCCVTNFHVYRRLFNLCEYLPSTLGAGAILRESRHYSYRKNGLYVALELVGCSGRVIPVKTIRNLKHELCLVFEEVTTVSLEVKVLTT
jgi:hypothetical protein